MGENVIWRNEMKKFISQLKCALIEEIGRAQLIENLLIDCSNICSFFKKNFVLFLKVGGVTWGCKKYAFQRLIAFLVTSVSKICLGVPILFYTPSFSLC